jgi:hypothetical protein
MIELFGLFGARSFTLRPFSSSRQLSISKSIHQPLKMSTTTTPPPISHILETCLYVRDISASANFYKETFQIEPFLQTVCHSFILSFFCAFESPILKSTSSITRALFLSISLSLPSLTSSLHYTQQQILIISHTISNLIHPII